MAESQPQSILLAFSDPDQSRVLFDLISPFGREIVQTASVQEAVEALSEAIWLAFCEDHLAGGGYAEFLRRTTLAGLQVPVVVAAPSGGPEQYVEAMRLGAHDYITAPYQPKVVELILQRRCEERSPLVLPVQIYGVDAEGVPFLENAQTLDISSHGAKLGVHHQLRLHSLVGVSYYEKGGVFRVAWVRNASAPSGLSEVGVQVLGKESCPWGFH